MRFLRIFVLICALLGVAFATPAMAQDKVSARSGGHDGYSRLVFEWPQAPAYSLSKENDRVLVRFSKAGTLDTAGISADDKNIKGVKTLSSGAEPLQVAVTIPAGSKFRDFVVDNKLILDVYDSDQAKKEAPKEEPKPAAIETTKEPTKETPATKEAAKPAVVKETPPVAEKTPVPETKKGDFTVSKGEDGEAAPIGGVETASVPAPQFSPHVITLTTITSVGMAAFERNGWLWIVVDSPDLPNAPQLTGPQKDKFSKFEKIDVPGGAAYRMDLPDGLNAYGEGGGLSWRIVLTPKEKAVNAVAPVSQVAGDGSKLVWPMANMRKAITFTDPIVGDTITAITATDASQVSGSSRRYVNLRTLDGVIGLSYVPKSDDVKADIKLPDVTIGRPGGLALSNAKDLQPEQIRAAAEAKPEPEMKEAPATDAAHEEAQPNEDNSKAAKHEDEVIKVTGEPVKDAPGFSKEELTKATDEKPSGNNVFNFPRWEMGGLPALEKNLHVMMTEVSNKEPDKRTEDIITMAKLLIANDRGQEALGMLRIALQQVPELDDNAEFQSMRGAALALSGKYDEAINDFSRDSLQNYDDVKYWRAFTLAGLEDWKQAGDVLPSDVSPIATYPQSIRTPLALAFAETELRNGKPDQSEAILDILKPELPKLSLPYASAWNYLQGETERQKGDSAAAIEYWEPLVKHGKDDLYRAKAGLSLTKLQLDEKKLKPTEAIDRLEGLRYAWRGDELETLINYRLGKMYIDNKEYLKGLTVLRNATTLTPGLQVGQDVKTYLVNSFRDIFMNGKLDTISPLEAISIYEEFKDLAPPGGEGDVYVDKLAERLVDADLLGRAAALLEYQVNNRLQGDKKAEVAIRLAAIRLLDGNPDGALRSLEIAQDTLNKMEAGQSTAPAPKPAPKEVDDADPANVTPEAGDPATPPAQKVDPEKQRQIYLLKARALSMKKKPDDAIAILDKMRPDADVSKLRTDIAWGSGKWEEAAMSLNDLIVAEDISPKRPLTEYQRDIILNRAIALNLSGNRVALANLRERYNAQMKDTTKGQMFEVVTRPRRPDMIGSREAIESMISEIDLFKGFLDGYSKMDAMKKSGTAEPASLKEPAPADANTGPAAATSETPAEKSAE